MLRYFGRVFTRIFTRTTVTATTFAIPLGNENGALHTRYYGTRRWPRVKSRATDLQPVLFSAAGDRVILYAAVLNSRTLTSLRLQLHIHMFSSNSLAANARGRSHGFPTVFLCKPYFIVESTPSSSVFVFFQPTK